MTGVASRRWQYRCHGLVLVSDRPLRHVAAVSAAAADIELHLAARPAWLDLRLHTYW